MVADSREASVNPNCPSRKKWHLPHSPHSCLDVFYLFTFFHLFWYRKQIQPTNPNAKKNKREFMNTSSHKHANFNLAIFGLNCYSIMEIIPCFCEIFRFRGTSFCFRKGIFPGFASATFHNTLLPCCASASFRKTNLPQTFCELPRPEPRANSEEQCHCGPRRTSEFLQRKTQLQEQSLSFCFPRCAHRWMFWASTWSNCEKLFRQQTLLKDQGNLVIWACMDLVPRSQHDWTYPNGGFENVTCDEAQ